MAQQASVQSLFDSMSDMQRQLLNQWSKSGNAMPVGEQLERSYQQQLELSEQVVDQALKMQGEWMHQVCDVMKGANGTPKEFRELVERSEQTMDQMLQARADLWHSWFKQARQLHLDKLPQMPGGEVWTRMMETMEQQAKETMEKAAAAADGEAGAPSAKSTKAPGGESQAT